MVFVQLVLLAFLWCGNSALDNGLALTPPLGWMAWERYRCVVDCDTYPDECISERLFRKVADLLVSEGYSNVGYRYIIIDDCWLDTERDSDGALQADPERFPSGIKDLAEYVHSKGLLFGIYEDYGNYTCGGYPGVLGHLEQDANTFAEWGVDYVKLDGCYTELEDMATECGKTRMDRVTNEWVLKECSFKGNPTGSVSSLESFTGYPEFGMYLNRTGRPMVYSCSWPAYQEGEMDVDYEAISQTCNLWRNYGDIQDSWSSVASIMDWFALNQDRIAPYAGPGHWNDPDMLIIGDYGLSYEQSKTQMAVWAILAAPLLLSTDIAAVKKHYKEILQNTDILAVNQDPLGIQGKRVYMDDSNTTQVWTRAISPKQGDQFSYAVALVSRRTDGIPHPFSISLEEIGLNNTAGYIFKELYTGETFTLLSPQDEINVRIVPTGVVFYRAIVLNTNNITKEVDFEDSW